VPEPPFNADPIPATPIGEMKVWQLHIECGRCWLAECLGGRTRIAEVVRRSRCAGFRGRERCRGTPKRVILVKVATYGKTTRRVREITVVGRSRQS
jgi:hypothetical protein